MQEFNLNTILSDIPKHCGNVEELEVFKFPNGYGFPESYKKFVQEFGYGLTLGEFIIYIPMGNYCDSIFIQSEAIKQSYISDVLNNDIWFDIEPDGSIDLLKRLYPFASSENGMYLFWDINDYQDNEYDIYMTDFRGVGFKKIGKNLYELIDNLTTPSKLKRYDSFAIEPYPNTFKKIYRV